MIDSFWTKWRIRQLARGETLLVGKWLEDYARWLYGRLWYRCGENRDRAQQLLEEVVVSAAEQLATLKTIPSPLSDWLLSIYEQCTAKIAAVDKPSPTDPNLRKAVLSLSWQPVSQAESYWPQLSQLSQQALALLSCDERCLLLCRYFYLERPAHTAAQYNMSLPEIQTVLYRAGHSFRRNLEAITQVGAQDLSQAGRPDLAMLEANFEKIFRSLVPESPTPEFMAQLKERVRSVLSQHGRVGWGDSARKFGIFVGAALVLAGITIFYIWRQGTDSIEPEQTKTAQQSDVNAQSSVSSAPVPDAAQEVQLAVRLGNAGDVEGLLAILRMGSFPAQIAAAHYLGRYGDKSAINLLDQAAQKWQAENSGSANPFLEAILAIENRMRQQIQEEAEAARLARIKESALKTAESIRRKQSNLKEPNVPAQSRTNQDAEKPAIIPEEPNLSEPALIVYIEPNQPPIIEEYGEYPQDEPNEPSMAEDVNEVLPVEDIDLPLYEYPGPQD